MTKRTTKQPDAVTVRYNLHDLPTAQHKAGLAGLLLQVESMRERVERGVLPADTPLVEVIKACPASAQFRFTAASTQALFDDLYAANLVEKWTRTWNSSKKGKPIRSEVVDVPVGKSGKVRKETRHFYADAEPAGPFLARYTDDGKELWHKLWRDMLWAIPRGKPTTRGPFYARAEGKPTKDGADAWKALLTFEKAADKGELKTTEVAGAVFLGAQAVNAESVRFEDRTDHALLLHFWQLTARVFVPEQIDADGSRKIPPASFVLAIAEISDLIEFAHAYKRSLSELRPDKHGYRPAEAVISLAAEGSMAFIRHLDRLASAKVLGRRPPDYLSGVEFFHMVKLGNNIKTASHGRIPASDGLLSRYEGLTSKHGPKNPLMLACRLRALLDGLPWFARLEDELVEREWSWFVHSTQDKHRTPSAMVGFAFEAQRQFESMIDNYYVRREARESQMNRSEPMQDSEAVDRVIYRLTNEYVHRLAASRCGVPDDHAGYKHERTHDPAGKELDDFKMERRHVASKLFLRLRSCHGDDFVEQFAANLGRISQWLPEQEFQLLSAALLRNFTNVSGENRPRTRDDIKTITLLALSAHSRSLPAKPDENDTNQHADQGEGE